MKNFAMKCAGGARWAAGIAALGLSLAFGVTAHAAPQYAMDCTSCHTMPPTDSGTTKKDPATGAMPGNHLGHASTVKSSCVVCHDSAVSSYGNSHRNKTIELVDGLGYSRKPVGGFLNQTSVPPNPLGTCATAACHSNGTTKVATPAWGRTPFTAPADCSQCHGVAPATGNHPGIGLGAKHAAYFGTGTGSCEKCHADHTGDAKPFSHATSAGRAIEVKFAGGGSFATNQCSNLYCHSNGKGTFKPPTWGGTLDCTGCHGNATSDTLSGKHAKHVNNASFLGSNYSCVECHARTVSSDTTIGNFSNHVNHFVDISGARVKAPSAGVCATTYCHSDGKGTQKSVDWNGAVTLDCKGCHGSDLAPDFASIAGEPNYTNTGLGTARANTHKTHVGAAASCVNCHSNTTTDGVSIKSSSVTHTNSNIDLTPGNGKSFTYSNNATKTCSDISCHSGGGIIVGGNTAQWGASLGCVGCHGDASTLASNAHAKHVNPVTGKAYACETCHNKTVSGSSTITAGGKAYHGNSFVDISGVKVASFTAATKTCATSCHNSATPQWNVTASGACGTCHSALSTTGGLIATNAHAKHFTAAYGPTFDPAAANSCAVCHVYTTDIAATHVNSSVDLNAGFSKNGTCTNCHKQTTDWTSGRVGCESCHTGALSVVNGKTAPDKTLAATAGHGKAGIAQSCAACHDNTSAHIGVAGGTKRLVADLGTANTNTNCGFCHNNPAVVVNPLHQHMPAHQASGLGSLCADCHDPHGSVNNMMVKTTINSTAVSFTGNSTFVNGASNGVCQVCHTTTQHFTKAGVTPPSAHVDSTTNCLDCHKHNPATGLAFMPSGSCDACHGYPPMPRNLGSFGFTGNWSSARFEDYSGGGGAHMVAAHIPKGARASDGWVNCIPCHSGAGTSHAKVLPIRNHVENITVLVDPQYRFNNDAFSTYTGAKLVSAGANKSGNCFNVSCHFKPSPKWSVER